MPDNRKRRGKGRGREPLKNPRHELFAQLVAVKQKTQVDAYCMAIRRDPKQPRATSTQRAAMLACREHVARRITYLQNKRIKEVLKKIDSAMPQPEECVVNARYGIKQSMLKDDLNQLNQHNRTLADIGGFFKMTINQRTMVIDEDLDDYGDDGAADEEIDK